jgi:hypothetical protein
LISDDGDFDIGDEMSANLMLDPENRVWKLEIMGSAAFILHFMLDSTEASLTGKLWDEAKFDRLIKYDLGELDENR